jgi:REP element-mobilizing transposase RayT
MNRDTRKYAHGLKRIWVHESFKVKYCHKIFAHKQVRDACQEIMLETAKEYNIEIKYIGFDADHLHFIPDLGKYSEPYIRKLFKGRTARKLLKKFWWLKQTYFYGSGLWGRQYFCYSIGSDMAVLSKYVQSQKYFQVMYNPNQRTLQEYHPV